MSQGITIGMIGAMGFGKNVAPSEALATMMTTIAMIQGVDHTRSTVGRLLGTIRATKMTDHVVAETLVLALPLAALIPRETITVAQTMALGIASTTGVPRLLLVPGPALVLLAPKTLRSGATGIPALLGPRMIRPSPGLRPLRATLLIPLRIVPSAKRVRNPSAKPNSLR